MRDVWIIPNNDDIFDEGLTENLWWTNEECIDIKRLAHAEFEKTVTFNRGKNRRHLYKTMWYELDFDKIYEIAETYKLTHKIELKTLCELYTIQIKQ
jgi:hypothetical protein